MRPGLLSCLLLCCLLSAARAADAPPPSGSAKQNLCLQDPVCRQHSTNAKELSKSGKLAAAIDEYTAAYAEVQIPVFLYNIGRLHQRLGNQEQAAAHYRRYIAAAMDDDPAQIARAQDYLKQVEAPPPPPSPPPQPTAAAPPPPSPAPTPAVEKTPIYKKWWFWTIAGAVVAGTAVGVGLGVTRGGGTPPPKDVPIPDGVAIISLTF